MIDISNEIYTSLKTALGTVNYPLYRGFENDGGKFPCCTFTELPISSVGSSVDSGGVTQYYVGFQIDVFASGNSKMTTAKKMRDIVDGVLGTQYKLDLNSAQQVENYTDPTIYRYNMRYIGTVDTNKKLYRR